MLHRRRQLEAVDESEDDNHLYYEYCLYNLQGEYDLLASREFNHVQKQNLSARSVESETRVLARRDGREPPEEMSIEEHIQSKGFTEKDAHQLTNHARKAVLDKMLYEMQLPLRVV